MRPQPYQRSILADALFIGLPVILFLIGLVWLIAQEVKG